MTLPIVIPLYCALDGFQFEYFHSLQILVRMPPPPSLCIVLYRICVFVILYLQFCIRICIFVFVYFNLNISILSNPRPHAPLSALCTTIKQAQREFEILFSYKSVC